VAEQQPQNPPTESPLAPANATIIMPAPVLDGASAVQPWRSRNDRYPYVALSQCWVNNINTTESSPGAYVDVECPH